MSSSTGAYALCVGEPREAEEGTEPPGGGVTGSCKLCSMGAKTAQSLRLQSPNHFYSVNLQGHQQVTGVVDAGLFLM